jgi:hypothetical protein
VSYRSPWGPLRQWERKTPFRRARVLIGFVLGLTAAGCGAPSSPPSARALLSALGSQMDCVTVATSQLPNGAILGTCDPNSLSGFAPMDVVFATAPQTTARGWCQTATRDELTIRPGHVLVVGSLWLLSVGRDDATVAASIDSGRVLSPPCPAP